MIAVTTADATVRIMGEVPIPYGKAWDQERIACLVQLIGDYVRVAELVDRDTASLPARVSFPPRQERRP